jgi:hypothetical protein
VSWCLLRGDLLFLSWPQVISKWKVRDEQQRVIHSQWKMDPFDPIYLNTMVVDHLSDKLFLPSFDAWTY